MSGVASKAIALINYSVFGLSVQGWIVRMISTRRAAITSIVCNCGSSGGAPDKQNPQLSYQYQPV